MIFLTDTILQRMFVPLDPRPFKDNDNLTAPLINC